MIIEGILTTLNPDGRPNIAAMGATLDIQQIGRDGLWAGFELKPFGSSRTYQNLKRHPEGVFHLVDDAELLARAALSEAENARIEKAAAVEGWVLSDSVRAYEFQLKSADWSETRAHLKAGVIHSHQFRQWSGWNRAQHAVLELTIMATRVKWLPRVEIQMQLQALKPLIEKTAGPSEWAGWHYVVDYLARQWADGQPRELLRP